MTGLVLIFSKILIAISVLGLLRCSGKFRSMSSELDEQVFTALRRIMHTTEESGYPPLLIPLLMLLTALTFMLSAYVTTAAVR
jgi:hypothetical protein